MSNTALENQLEGLLARSGDGGDDPPERTKIATRERLGELLAAAGLLALAAIGCADGNRENKKDDLETLRQALNAQLSAYVLCVTEGNETTFPSTLVSNTGNDDDKYFPDPIDEENVDWANLPTTAKRFAWKNYTLEPVSDYVQGGGHYNVYSWSNGQKTKVGQINANIISGFYPENDLFIQGTGSVLTLWKLSEEPDGTVSGTEIGNLPDKSLYSTKDGYILRVYKDGSSLHLAAILVDPSNQSNPLQTVKDVVYHTNKPGSWGNGFDYSEGILVTIADNGCKIYKNLPEGVDFIDNLDNYLDSTITPPDSVSEVSIVNGYVFLRLGETQIHIIHPDGTEQTIHKDDLEKGLFKDMVKTSKGVLVMCAPQPYLFEINEDGTVTPQPDPGDHTSEAEECSPLSQQQAEEMFGMGQPPDPTEPDPELSPPDAGSEPGKDIFVQPDPELSGQPDTVQPDTTGPDTTDPDLGNDIQPDPDTEPDTTAPDLGNDIQPDPDTEPDTIDPDLGKDIQPDPDTEPDTIDPDLGKDIQPGQDTEPDIKPDASMNSEQTSEQDQKQDASTSPETVNPEMAAPPPKDHGCSCSTTEPRNLKGLKGQATMALIALFTLLKLRRKEKEASR